ncbi:uncharacterized protein MKZ38_007279 [Zalerion maritima]|uniref:N-acetyltransferase domain-containing protein n=1 Tax=Zalerion maritima TaxID=339359 RepID=A0AAD5RIX5_9PEZI|nr:uncharacterized protein MKZ38_007279 [Zalerion maritima]
MWGNIPTGLKPAGLEGRNGEVECRVVNNDGARESLVIPLQASNACFKNNFRKCPRITSHVSPISIVKIALEVIDGMSFRKFRDRKFAEIVFCAVSSDQQVKGYGAHLMAHLKDYVKATSPVMPFSHLRRNSATGYFQKQWFTKKIALDKSVWMGYLHGHAIHRYLV